MALWIFGPLSTLAAGGWAVFKAFGWLVGKVVAQFEARLDERFAAQETARSERSRLWEARLARVDDNYAKIDRELRDLLINLPDRYVRREDYVRRETVIEAKIDQLSLRIQNWILEKKNA